MKNHTPLSPKTQMLLFPLIPCEFTLLDLLAIKILQDMVNSGIAGPAIYMISALLMLISIIALVASWFWVGGKGYLIHKGYWKALLIFNSIGLLCLIFAILYYTHTTINTPTDGFAWWTLCLSNNPVLDLIAGIYSSGYFVGSILASSLLKPVIYPIAMVIINTFIGLLIFSLGYFYRKSKEEKKEIAAIIKETKEKL
jgi:hypothetical protein